MGKAKILGAGASAPLNSKKVEEAAGELIPANYFVSKKEGIVPFSNPTFSSGDLYKSINIDDTFDILVRKPSSSLSTELLVLKDKKLTQQISATVAAGSYTSCFAIMHVRALKKIIVTTEGAAASSYAYVGIWSYTDDGTIALDKDTKITNFTSITKEINCDNISFVSGDYDSNFFYAICSKISTVENYVIKCTLDENEDIKVLSTYKIQASSALTNSRSSSSYLKELNVIISTYNIIIDLNDFSTKQQNEGVLLIVRLGDAGIFGYSYCIDASKKIIYLATINNWKTVDIFHIDTGTYESITLTATTSHYPTGSSDMLYGYTLNPVYNNKIYCVSTAKRIGVIDVVDMTYTDIGEAYTSYLYQGTISVLPKLIQNRIQFFMIVNAAWYISEYYLGLVMAAKEDDPIYGISLGRIKQHEIGNICTVSDEPVSLYGINETIVNKIKDDSVDEVKGVVTNGLL